MDMSKISSELYMAINVPESVRENSLDLNVGYDDYFNEWELIIRYTGDLDNIRKELNISIEELLGGYAIVRAPSFRIAALSEYRQIDYIEKPKSLLLNEMNGVNASCVARVRLPDLDLRGRGILVACLDSGVDIYHPDFQNQDNTTRIERLWDQTIPGNPPERFRMGSVYTNEEINIAIASGRNSINGRELVPEYDSTGHGTAVLGIMAGNGRENGGNNAGMAPEAGIVAVKLGNPDDRGFPRTTQLMLAVDYSVRYAISVGKPIAINISYGNNYGAHNGDSILERYLDMIASTYRTSVVVGVGNEGVSSRHASGYLQMGSEEVVEIFVGEYMQSFNLQIWKNYQDDFEVYVETPAGRRVGPVSQFSEVQIFSVSGNTIAAYYGMPTPYNPQQEIYISFGGNDEYVAAGVWRLILRPVRVTAGWYDMWLPVAGSTTAEVTFARPDVWGTLSVPSTARYVLSVAAYDSVRDSYASFSGRGVPISPGESVISAKPDLVAPGVAINSTRAGGGYGEFSGTSFAAPFVTGAAALLMQYGLIDGNDSYLYGEKLRAELIRGARPLTVQENFPSPLLGWGALCVADSLRE